jgi:5-methylcytosine-specific restriction enzyme A
MSETDADTDPSSPELFFCSAVDEEHLAREKAKARELRRSPWWKRRRSSGRCHYCGRAVPPRELTMDHVVPLIRGGKTVKSNVVPCCKECNARKRYLLPIEWAEYLERLAGGESGPT